MVMGLGYSMNALDMIAPIHTGFLASVGGGVGK